MITAHKLENRIQTLKEKHQVLDKSADLQYSNYIDDVKLKAIKVERLRIKSEIDELQQQLNQLEN